MYKHPWEYMDNTIKYMAEIKIIGAGPHSMTAIHSFAPTLWVDFLNSTPKSDKSIWLIYKKYTESIRELKEWMTEHKYSLRAISPGNATRHGKAP
jgi:hypothetical protein